MKCDYEFRKFFGLNSLCEGNIKCYKREVQGFIDYIARCEVHKTGIFEGYKIVSEDEFISLKVILDL